MGMWDWGECGGFQAEEAARESSGVPRRKSVLPVLTSYGDGGSHIVKYSGGWAG